MREGVGYYVCAYPGCVVELMSANIAALKAGGGPTLIIVICPPGQSTAQDMEYLSPFHLH